MDVYHNTRLKTEHNQGIMLVYRIRSRVYFVAWTNKLPTSDLVEEIRIDFSNLSATTSEPTNDRKINK